MEQKIHNTFTRMEDEIAKFDKVFAKGGKFEQAVAQSGGDIAWFDDMRSALDKLAETLMDCHQAAMPNMDEDVNEGRLGFSDIEKFGDEAASKIDMECRRRGSADMEPGDADELRYKVAKEMGYIKESTLTEGVLDADDDDGFMARSQLYFLARDAITLHGIIDDRQDLEPWVQSKIAQAAQGIDAVRRYTEYNAMKQEMPMDGAMDMEESKSEGDAWYIEQDAKRMAEKDGHDWSSLPYGRKSIYRDKAAEMRKGDDEEDMFEVDKSSIDAAVKQAMSADIPTPMPRPKLKPKTLPRPKPRPTMIGSNPKTGATRGIDPRDNYSPEDLKRLLNQSEGAVDEGAYGKKKKKKYYEEAEEKHYMCVHAKKGTHKCTAKSSYEAAKKAAELWGMKSTAGIDAHLMEGIEDMKKAGNAKAEAEAKERKKSKVDEGMEFDEKRNDDLQTVAKDLFANAKAAAEKKVK